MDAPMTYYQPALPPGHPLSGPNGRASMNAIGSMSIDSASTNAPIYNGISIPSNDSSYNTHYRPVSSTTVPQQYQQQPMQQQPQQHQQQYVPLQGVITPLPHSQSQLAQQHVLPQHQQQSAQSLPLSNVQHPSSYKQHTSYISSTQAQHLPQLQQQQVHHIQPHQVQQVQPQLVQRQQILGTSSHQSQAQIQTHVHQQIHNQHAVKSQVQHQQQHYQHQQQQQYQQQQQQQQQQQLIQQQQQQQQRQQQQQQAHKHYEQHHRDHRNPPAPMDHVVSPQTSTLQLAEFASVMVYTLWHTRPNINGASSNAYNVVPHRISVPPSAGPAFRKFCLKVLSATQLSSSVILLSLKYIQKLLKNNPSIHGQQGSEFRLFTVSLMLANKFLDDNTFTNKTWSEVTGISVQEINVMEMEFLNQVQFSLFVSEAEYLDWLHSLETWLKQQGQGQGQGQ
ncbi:hypothetical protein BGZ76_003548 [Entomortierella beljakovae]|nr:hypothetical protein BGZ76_003548 [Entomortierella beljakovae]